VKRFFRLAVFALLVGGWTLASASLHVVRTPGKVIVIPKDRVRFHDTFVDTRRWTLDNVSQHPDVSARLVHLGRADLLAHVVTDNTRGDVETQLSEAIAHPQPLPPTTRPAAIEKVVAEVHTATAAVKSIFN